MDPFAVMDPGSRLSTGPQGMQQGIGGDFAKKYLLGDVTLPCNDDEDSLAAEMAALAFFQYDQAASNSPPQKRLEQIYPDLAKCWKVMERTGSKDDIFRHVAARPGFERLVNEKRCLIADVYEGTRTMKQFAAKKKTPDTVPKQGFWLEKFSQAIAAGFDKNSTAAEIKTKSDFVQKWCGDPLVTPIPAMAFWDHLTQKTMDEITNNSEPIKGYYPEMPAPDHATLNGACPGGVKWTVSGHSMGHQLATITAYCNNYFKYKLWSQNPSGWPEWAKHYQFYSSIYTYAGRSVSGELIDFGSLVPKKGDPKVNFKGKPLSFAWDGLRVILGGKVIHDPNPDNFCAMPYDPMATLQLTDTCGEKKIIPVDCPVGSKSISGYSPDQILGLYKQNPCKKYQVYSLECPVCKDVFTDYRIPLHMDAHTYISFTQAAVGMQEGALSCPGALFQATQKVIGSNYTHMFPKGPCGGKFTGGPSKPGPSVKVLLPPSPLNIKASEP